MELSVAIRHILDGNAIIIMGSGASYGAKNALGMIPSGTGLAAYLYDKCGIITDDTTDLQDASQSYEEQFSAQALIQELRVLTTCVDFTESHEEIYTQPWMRYYTTNYDDVALLAAKKNGKNLTPVTISSEYRKYANRDNLCVHINGHIGNLNETTLHHEFKLTMSSFLSMESIISSPWGELLSHDLEAAKTVVILGLSLKYDLDLSRIIYKPNYISKTIIVTSPTATSDSERRLSRFGTVYKIGVDGFAASIRDEKKKYSPHVITPTDRLYAAFNYEYKKKYSIHSPSPDRIFKLFLNGQFDDSLYYKKDGKYQGIIDRVVFNDIKDAVLQGKKYIFIFSDMGNGKTACLNMLRNQLSREDIHIFVLSNADSPKLNEEIDSIYSLSKSSRVVVIIDDYTDYLDVVRQFTLHISENLQFVFSARTALNHAKMPTVLQDFNATVGDSTVLNINKLKKTDLNNCMEIFDQYGLFGRRANLSAKGKISFLSDYHGGASRFQTIMLEVLHSDVIEQKILELVSIIKKESKEYHNAVLLILLVKVMNLRLSTLDIERIVGVNISTDALFTSNPAINELITFGKTNELKIKAPVTAKFILQRVSDPTEIIDTLCSLASYAEKYSEIPKYSTLLSSIISYSHINSFLRGFKEPEKVLSAYYDELSKYNYYRNNNFFWLQYAISCIETKKFERAQQYLNTAYGLIPEDFVPYQINNQQARFYLERILENQSPSPTDDFLAAHRLLMIPISSPKDDEYNVIKLFRYYTKRKISIALSDSRSKTLYQKACKEAYQRTTSFLKVNTFYLSEFKDMQTNLMRISTVD